MTYQIISTFDGSITNCSLSELSQRLKLNSILCELGADNSVTDSWPLVHETLVTFAVEFADYALKHYTKKKIPEAEACITLTKQWLKNSDSVSAKELMAAANAADTAADAAADAAATYAADAATAAANAANAAAYAARAAANAAGKSKEAELIRQGGFIVEYLKNSSSK
jgi:hypothetical protein